MRIIISVESKCSVKNYVATESRWDMDVVEVHVVVQIRLGRTLVEET